jgi:rubrerythrin
MPESEKEKVKVIADFLATALDIEDKMSGEVYGTFLKRERWPPRLEDQTFQNIKKFLTALIEDTERHRQIFSNLIQKLEQKNAK